MAVSLPVYRIARGSEGAERTHEAVTSLFGLEKAELQQQEDSLGSRSAGIVVEIDRRSGGAWAADEERLWNPGERPSPPTPKEAAALVTDLLRGDSMPTFEPQGPFVLTELAPGRTVLVTRDNGSREQQQLDTQARYALFVRNPGVEGPDLVPVVGGGGKLTLTLGEGGRPVGLHHSLRAAEEAERVEAMGPEEAQDRFRKLTSEVEVVSSDSFLAYHIAPNGVEQEVIAPVYVFRATIRVDGRLVPMRLVTIPATAYGPEAPKVSDAPRRERQPGRLRAALEQPRRTLGARNPFEAGTSWIGLSGGLAGSQANAKGFVDGLAADGWLVNFNWGDANAWESDWRRNDDTWVDAADFVFYTGHADLNGWVLASPDDGSLTFTEVGAAPAASGDLWGRQDLEWAIIAACGPLQDDLLASGGGDVLARWDGAFDGLHSLMGYGAITFDNTEEGKRIVKYARQGTPLIDAWFRTAQEIQPSTNGAGAPDGPDVWVGAMWVTKPGADPRFDHLWGHGSVSADPRSPTGLACMWTTC